MILEGQQPVTQLQKEVARVEKELQSPEPSSSSSCLRAKIIEVLRQEINEAHLNMEATLKIATKLLSKMFLQLRFRNSRNRRHFASCINLILYKTEQLYNSITAALSTS